MAHKKDAKFCQFENKRDCAVAKFPIKKEKVNLVHLEMR